MPHTGVVRSQDRRPLGFRSGTGIAPRRGEKLVARTTWHIAAALAVPLLVLTACTDASTPGPEPTTTAPETTSPATPTTPSATPSPTPSPRDEAVAAATQAYEHYIEQRNEFAQAGYPAEEQPQLRLLMTDEHSQQMRDTWEASRQHGVRQEGAVAASVIDLVDVNDDLDEVQLGVCKNLTEYDIVDDDGQSLRPDNAPNSAVLTVTVRYAPDHYQGEDYWLVSQEAIHQDETC